MNKTTFKICFYITSVIVIAAVIASVIIADATSPPSVQSKTVSQSKIDEEGYVLTCKGDIVVAYRIGADKPFIKTTTSVSSLPHQVQEDLKAGIEVKTRQELNALIYEYCS